MEWDQSLLPEPTQPVAAQTGQRQSTRSGLIFTQSAKEGDAALDWAFTWHARYVRPETWTEEESRTGLRALTDYMAQDDLIGGAVMKCVALLGSMPRPILPNVLGQFEDIAQYEARMWRHRHQEVTEPPIRKRTVRLPLAK